MLWGVCLEDVSSCSQRAIQVILTQNATKFHHSELFEIITHKTEINIY